MHPGGRLPYHSDEIVRDLHPLPFYPFQSAGRLSRPANNERHLLFYIQFLTHCSTLHPKAQGAVCMFCRIFSAFLGVLTAAGAKSHTSVSYPAAWRHARSYRRFCPAFIVKTVRRRKRRRQDAKQTGPVCRDAVRSAVGIRTVQRYERFAERRPDFPFYS